MNADCIGKNLYMLRTMHKLTQEELGKKVSLSASAISNIEKSASRPSIDTLIRLAECFHVGVEYFLDSGNLELEKLKILTKLQIVESYLFTGQRQKYEFMYHNKIYIMEENERYLIYKVLLQKNKKLVETAGQNSGRCDNKE